MDKAQTYLVHDIVLLLSLFAIVRTIITIAPSDGVSELDLLQLRRIPGEGLFLSCQLFPFQRVIPQRDR
jgi:hypothetical protein